MPRKQSSSRLARAAVFVAVFACILVSGTSAQANATANATAKATAAPSNAPTPTVTSAPPTPTPTPVADTYAVPAPSAQHGSKDFAYTPNVQCTDVVANATFLIYSHNRALFDKCVVEGKYQIFPYPGTLPTQSQIDSMVRATSCRSVFTACVLANLPQCDIGGLALKSATETLLKISVDVLAGKEAPGSEKFYDMLLWRRDVNLAQAKGIPYDQKSQLYGEYSRNLWKALTNTTVKVSSDLKISFVGDDEKSLPSAVFANITTGSDASDIVGKVSAPDTSKGGNFTNGSNNATTNTSAGARPASTSGFVVVALTVTVMMASWW